MSANRNILYPSHNEQQAIHGPKNDQCKIIPTKNLIV